MSVSLGGITLDDNLQLYGVEGKRGLAVSKQVTILGRAILQTAPISSGEELTLAADRDGSSVYGYFTKVQIDSIRALRDAGAAVSLVHHKGTFTVLINELSDPEHLQDLVDPQDDDRYICSITMYEVG